MNNENEELLKLFGGIAKSTEGFTTRDVSSSTGFTLATVSRKINKGISEGIMEYVGKKEFKDVTGRKMYVPLYRIVKKKK